MHRPNFKDWDGFYLGSDRSVLCDIAWTAGGMGDFWRLRSDNIRSEDQAPKLPMPPADSQPVSLI
jgi:hypothetical protein